MWHSPYSDSISLRLLILLINLPHKLTRRVILQQAYHHTINSALIACTHTVSYSISLPARGSFHLSITVLVHYRLLTVFSLSKMVLLDSNSIQLARTNSMLWSYNPNKNWFGLFPFRSPLLRESLICFFFFQLLRCFNSLTCLYLDYVFI